MAHTTFSKFRWKKKDLWPIVTQGLATVGTRRHQLALKQLHNSSPSKEVSQSFDTKVLNFCFKNKKHRKQASGARLAGLCPPPEQTNSQKRSLFQGGKLTLE